MEKLLTIAIPTYNRKKELIRLLKSLEAQNCTELYSIFISDNCSDYSVIEAIDEEFKGQFRDIISISIRAINGGGDYNISTIFTQALTKLFWIIGDDDETLPGSIKSVINKSVEYPNVPFFKYTMSGSTPLDKDLRLKNVDDLIESNRKGYLIGGILFMSNNIYNVELLKPYFPDILYYGYCSACQIIPMMHCLVSSDYEVLLCKDQIVKYNPPEGEHWNYVKVVTQLSTILDINWENNHRDIVKIFRAICGYFGVGEFLMDLINIKDKSYRRYLYWKGMHTVYNRKKSVLDYFAILCYKMELYTRIPFMSKIYLFMFKKQEEIKGILKEKARTDPRVEKIVLLAKRYMPKLK